jgi:hypothetical protein
MPEWGIVRCQANCSAKSSCPKHTENLQAQQVCEATTLAPPAVVNLKGKGRVSK